MKARVKEGRYLARDEPGALRVTNSQGSYLFDEKGKRYVDFLMGWCVGNLGWGNAVVTRQVKAFTGPDYVQPGFSYKPWGDLAELLVSIAPGKLSKCFRATGGSEAVDLALQAALVHTGRTKFISLEGSYHGNSIGGLSVGDSEVRKRCKNLLPGCHKINPPLDETALKKIERLLERRDAAAFIMEPISINLGVLIPSAEFMSDLQRLCRKHGTLLIMDEVATGFGRTGKMFASEHFAIEPDILCLAKAITDGVGGMGTMMATAPVAKSMEEHGHFYSTYGWHPRSVDLAIATVRYLIANQKKLLGSVAEMSDYFRHRLTQMPFKKLSIKGLAICAELDDSEKASRIEKKCRRNGLLISSEEAKLLLLPALNIDPEIAEKGLDTLAACF